MRFKLNSISREYISRMKAIDIYNYLYDKNTKAISRARKISSIRSFFNYLCNVAKIIDRNPCVGLESPKLEKRLPKYLNLDEALSLLHSIDGKHKSRDYAIITLFLNISTLYSPAVFFIFSIIIALGVVVLGVNISESIAPDNNITGKTSQKESLLYNEVAEVTFLIIEEAKKIDEKKEQYIKENSQQSL